jgi:hypothetical protein
MKLSISSLLLLLLINSANLYSQKTGMIQGLIMNKHNNEPVPFANIVVWGTNHGTTSDLDGKFHLSNLTPGYHEVRVIVVGFKPYVLGSILVTNARPTYLEVQLEESAYKLEGVEVKSSPFRRSEESPVSLQRIGIAEIEKNPGGNRDICRVIQSLPGVASTPQHRNDVIVRGGGPSENTFYLDGIEIPNINHFPTQGASGGPVSIINADFIREANFYSGAFPASKGNSLSTVLDFRLLDGNNDRLKFRGAVGATDMALTLDGPLSQNSTFILSARRSYFQYLFDAIGLAFLPTYNDFQLKSRTRIDERNEITVIGIGAIDQFMLNTDMKNTEPDQRYLLSYMPVNYQWSYTVGVVYKHFRENGFDTWVVSRNVFNNRQFKHRNNDKNDIKVLDYTSQELENKFRYEHDRHLSNGIKFNIGGGFEHACYTNSTYRALFIDDNLNYIDYETELNLFRWSVFGQMSKAFFNNRLNSSFGIRTDANSYSDEMSNLLRQISPRVSFSYEISRNLYANLNTGRYYQQPPYTMLGFALPNGKLVNKDNGLKYIISDHLVGGFEWIPNPNSRITLEGFHKWYSNYPFSPIDSISLSSKGADFGTYGDEEVVSTGKGRAFGIELLFRARDVFKFNTMISYTLAWSQSENTIKELSGDYIPTSWDNRHIFVITAIRSFSKGWDFGFKWRYVGGRPYTPWDIETSSLIEAWDSQGRGFQDYSRFNTLRLKPYHQLDIRIDKALYEEKWTLNFYLDIQNLYNSRIDEPDILLLRTDEQGNALINPNDPSRYLLDEFRSAGGGVILPTIGIIVEF